MTTPLDLERALALGSNPAVGSYRYIIATQEWWWSPQVYAIHGFAPGEVVPTTALILAHKHPDDRDRVSRVLRTAILTGEPFTSMHRIMDGTGSERNVVIVGRGHREPGTGRLGEIVGYFLDVTPCVASLAADQATASILASARNRASIEQAKGILAHVFGTPPEDAFEMLRTASNRTNTPVRQIAHDMVELAASGPGCSAEKIAALLAAPV